jgi:hypothetical protein
MIVSVRQWTLGRIWNRSMRVAEGVKTLRNAAKQRPEKQNLLAQFERAVGSQIDLVMNVRLD